MMKLFNKVFFITGLCLMCLTVGLGNLQGNNLPDLNIGLHSDPIEPHH